MQMCECMHVHMRMQTHTQLCFSHEYLTLLTNSEGSILLQKEFKTLILKKRGRENVSNT